MLPVIQIFDGDTVIVPVCRLHADDPMLDYMGFTLTAWVGHWLETE